VGLPPNVKPDLLLEEWSAYLGGDQPLLLVRNPDRARRLLMQAAGVSNGEPVGIPVNCRRGHSEAVKRSNGTPTFYELSPELEADLTTLGVPDIRIVWLIPTEGAPPGDLAGRIVFVDWSESLPSPGALQHIGGASAVVWGLHLTDEVGRDPANGALIAFNDAQLYSSVASLVTAEDLPSLCHARAQLEQLAGPSGIAARQMRLLGEAQVGKEAGAGLPMIAGAGTCALPRGIAFRVPEAAEVATFISYVRNENVTIEWLPEFQPMFYVAYQVTEDRARTFQSATNLARWIISPLGPDFNDDQIVHAVLGPLKAAEYTGVRWYTDPGRAAWYGNLMLEWYGPTHDAYRPSFLVQSNDGEYLSERLT
jgi:hypothetical protein